MKISMLTGFAALALSASAGTCLADVVLFQDDFQSAHISSSWSSNSHIANDGPFTYFNGRYSAGSSTLTLTAPSAPPPGAQYEYSVKFDLYIIDSWDGDDQVQGPDRFIVTANNTNVFDETFANQHEYQSYRQPDVGPAMLGFHSAFKDSIYRNITVPFSVAPGQSIVLKFWDSLRQGVSDESWGLDNVTVSYRTVPAPAALALFGLAGPIAARRRR